MKHCYSHPLQTASVSVFFNWAFHGLLFLYFRLSYAVFLINFVIQKMYPLLDSTRISLVLEATTLPTAPQPLQVLKYLIKLIKRVVLVR